MGTPMSESLAEVCPPGDRRGPLGGEGPPAAAGRGGARGAPPAAPSARPRPTRPAAPTPGRLRARGRGAQGSPTGEELMGALPGACATRASSEPYTERVFREAPDLRVIARWGVGFDAIDAAAATRHHVAVCTAVGANHEAVADYT